MDFSVADLAQCALWAGLESKGTHLNGTITVDLDVVAGRNDVGGRLDCLAVGGEGVARGGGDSGESGGISLQLISSSVAAGSIQQYFFPEWQVSAAFWTALMFW